jgi:hypothetical protein
MPTAGTHITILERLALTGEFADIIGDLDADEASDAGKRLRFAKLGAIGPDIFYALMDYGPELQQFADFLSKLAGSIECISKLTKDIDTKLSEVEADITLGTSTYFKEAIDEFQQTFDLMVALIHQGLMALVIQQGVNLFPIFQARRQLNEPRNSWFWADYLHYVRTGRFVRELFVQSAGNPNFRAFSYGYLSHYITDVTGHPFINEIVGSPWRMYWQRHHLVENFVDTYIWDRWHDSHSGITDPASGEQPLDTIRAVPNASIGDGAPFTFARLNDHINIGTVAGNDPIDAFLMGICKNIRAGLENIGVLDKLPDPPNDADLNDWADALVRAFRAAYPQPPQNLPNGYPTSDDIKEAYSLLRLFLRISTEESITEPQFPNIAADVWNAVKKLWDDVEKKLGSAPPLPSPGFPGSFEDLWEAIKAFLDWAVKTAIAIGEAAFQFIKDAIAVAGVLLVDLIRAGLYLIKKALFDIYKYFRFFLVRAAYSIPFTDELTEELGGGINAVTLWNTAENRPLYSYPKEEIAALEETRYPSHYVPWVPPELLAEMRPPNRILVEQPQTWMGPYGGNAPADAFIEPPVGARAVLSPAGPISFNIVVTPGTPFIPPSDFGGALQNCVVAFRTVLAAEQAGNVPVDLFPDYNLDGDRGYGWACWDTNDNVNPPAGGTVTVHPYPIP